MSNTGKIEMAAKINTNNSINKNIKQKV